MSQTFAQPDLTYKRVTKMKDTLEDVVGRGCISNMSGKMYQLQ